MSDRTRVTVPARGTSAICPGCLGALGHHPAPDRLHERGWKWAHCTHCGLSMDRDHAAARRILSRGLAPSTGALHARPDNDPQPRPSPSPGPGPGCEDFPPYARCAYGPRHQPPGVGTASGGA